MAWRRPCLVCGNDAKIAFERILTRFRTCLIAGTPWNAYLPATGTPMIPSLGSHVGNPCPESSARWTMACLPESSEAKFRVIEYALPSCAFANATRPACRSFLPGHYRHGARAMSRDPGSPRAAASSGCASGIWHPAEEMATPSPGKRLSAIISPCTSRTRTTILR